MLLSSHFITGKLSRRKGVNQEKKRPCQTQAMMAMMMRHGEEEDSERRQAKSQAPLFFAPSSPSSFGSLKGERRLLPIPRRKKAPKGHFLCACAKGEGPFGPHSHTHKKREAFYISSTGERATTIYTFHLSHTRALNGDFFRGSNDDEVYD